MPSTRRSPARRTNRKQQPQVAQIPPAPASEPAAPVEPVAAEQQAPAPVVQPDVPAAPESTPPAPASEPAADLGDTAERITVGAANGLLRRMPLADVLVHLDAFEGRIAVLRETQAVLDLQPRLRASEGRCAPIYFTGDDDGEPEHLVAGIETVAAALNLGEDRVFVVTVLPGDIASVSAHIDALAAAAKPPASPA